MRSSCVPLAIYAGAVLAAAAFGAAPAGGAAGGCCGDIETPGTKVSDEVRPGAGVNPTPDANPQPTPLDKAEGIAVGGEAYRDVFRALKDDNPCSRFFGGPRVAVKVFNAFARQLRRKTLGAGDVGLTMTGSYTWYQEAKGGASYRLFDEAAVNTNGPFFVVPPPSKPRFQVGRFPATSRAGKALMLLHELGHLIRGPDGWLLPNDGGDAELSDRNTRTVESRCLGQLLALRE